MSNSSFCFTFSAEAALEDYTSDYTLQVLVGLLHDLYICRDFHDPWDCIHVIDCGCPLWCSKRCSSHCVRCHCRALSTLFFISDVRKAHFPLSAARKNELLPSAGELSSELLSLGHKLKQILFLTFRWLKGGNGCWTTCFSWGWHRLCPAHSPTVLPPMVDLPYHIVFLVTVIGFIPASFVTVKLL